MPPGADTRTLGLLPLGPGLATIRLSPAELPRFAASHPNLPFSIWPGLHPVLEASTRLNRTDAYRLALADSGLPIAGTGRGVVVGIVDTGIDPRHADLRDREGASRLAWLLDFASFPRGRHAELEEAFGCTSPTQSSCAVFDKDDIDRALAGDLGVLLPIDPVGHGTHVSSIAAGNGGSGTRFIGGAPDATIIVASVAHSGAAATVADVDIVTATRFIFDRAEQLGLPAVVNLSLGGDFGPHDGTTPIEVALAEMVGPAHPGRSIVVAGGNSGALYRGDEEGQVFGIHTENRVTRGVPAKLAVLTPDARKGIDLSGTGFVWITYGAADAISIGLRGPKGMSIRPVAKGGTGGFRASDDSLTAAIYNGAVHQSPLPADSNGAVIVWDGKWPPGNAITVELEGEGFAGAWVEAQFDDAAAAGAIFFEVATRAGTINVPASHPDLIAVGCTVNRTEWIDRDRAAHDITQTPYSALSPADGSCYFSSAGPSATGASKPDISAPGALVAAAMSADAVPGASPFSAFQAPSGLCPDGNQCLVVDGEHALLSGSSMASPQVAGAIALLFERDPRLTQPEIRRILQGGARRPAGSITADYQLGAGALDVVGAVAALEARTMGIVRDPDASASWLTLANNYLHPGGGPPLIGTVLVRAADGSIADGFEPGRLALQVGEDSIVEQPLSRIGPGLYRFALRAPPGTGSRLLRLEVAIDGTPIGGSNSRVSGRRLVPIGADRWIASGSARIYGGCSVDPRSGSVARTNGSLAAPLVSSIVAAFVARRKRARRKRARYPNVPPSYPQR